VTFFDALRGIVSFAIMGYGWAVRLSRDGEGFE